MNHLIFLGAPGSGKGTQALQLANELDFEIISTGNLIRNEVQAQSSLGKQVESVINSGALVSDELIIALFEKKLKEVTKPGVIADGFPRTLAQAKAYDQLIGSDDKVSVVYIDVSLPSILERITGRSSCQTCGQIFHDTLNPPPDPATCQRGVCQITKRKDDSKEVVERRYEIYQREIGPILTHYSGKLIKINGETAPQSVHDSILSVV